ncbi:MAG: dGTP triphosphohydrolase [Microbacteriaceae bacterium]
MDNSTSPRTVTPSGQAATRRRMVAEPAPPDSEHGDDEFRVDLERVRFSPYFSRLSAVTQVIPQAGSGTTVHNRLTHSLKVTAVARSIAISLSDADEESQRIISDLGGCEPVVVQAAASAHDLGHPPFGHLGEQVLDRLARDRLGLTDGFEGNAQTFRIITALDATELPGRGLNTTAAVRAAVLKYPWTKSEWRSDSVGPADLLPRGVGVDRRLGAWKYSAYLLGADEMADVLTAYPAVKPYMQTVECSVMDIADDIAYSVHDLDDFYRAGILEHTTVSAELTNWLENQGELAALELAELEASIRTPGYSLESTWRRIQDKDAWIADEGAFRESVIRVQEGLVEGLLAVPYDGAFEADRAVAAFTRHWINRLKSSISVQANPDIRSSHVQLTPDAWHDVVVLKFVHSRFVLDRPELRIYQRGQAKVLESLVDGFYEWLRDPEDGPLMPRRLTDSVEATTQSYFELRERSPGLLPAGISDATLVEFGRGRALIDYIASFTDAQAMSAAALLSGTSERLWETGRSL